MKSIQPHYVNTRDKIVSNVNIHSKTFPHSFFPIAVFWLNKHEAKILIMNVWNSDDTFEHSFKINVNDTDEERTIKFNNNMFNDDKCYIIVSVFNELKTVELKHNFPRNVFSTFETYEIQMKKYNSVIFNRMMNPGYHHYFYNDDDRRNMIRDNFDSNVLRAYDDLVPGAYRADLWRLCCLYLYGGIYIDDKLVPLVNFDSLLNKYYNEECLLVEDFYGFEHYGVYNAFIISKPNNVYIKKCIDRIVENINNHYYGNDAWSITGPRVLGDIFKEHGRKNGSLPFAVSSIYDFGHNVLVVSEKDVPIVSTPWNYEALKNPTDRYQYLYDNKKVYKSENNNIESFSLMNSKDDNLCYIFFVLIFIITMTILIIK